MDNASQVPWLHRRAGFGLHPDQLAVQHGVPAADVLDGLLAQVSATDPWAGLVCDGEGERADAIVAWLAHLRASAAPYLDRRTWNLHGAIDLTDLLDGDLRPGHRSASHVHRLSRLARW